MNSNKLILSILGIAIGIIVLGSVLVPVVQDARSNSGPIEVYNNNLLGNYRLVESNESLEIDLTFIDSSIWEISINGEIFSMGSDANVSLLISDAITISKNAAGSVMTISTPDGEIRNSANKTISFDNGLVTVSVPTQAYSWSGPYSWVYVLDENGPLGNHAGTAPAYVNTVKDLYGSGYYSTGENNCYYDIINGEVSISGEWETSLTYTLTPIEGTTDIFEISDIVVHVGDESFTPYRYLVPEEITGHKSSGPAYGIYGVIPVVVLVAILLCAIQIIRERDA